MSAPFSAFEMDLQRKKTVRKMLKKIIILVIFSMPVFADRLFDPALVDISFYFNILLAYLLVLLAFVYPIRVNLFVKLFSSFVLLVGVLFFQSQYGVLTGPDSLKYFNVIKNFDIDKLTYLFIDRISFDGYGYGFLFYSDIFFPAIVKLFIGKLVVYEPKIVVVFNILFWVLASYIWVGALDKNINVLENKKFFLTLTFFCMLTSPVIIFWSSALNKEIVSVSISVFAAIALINKKYICFVLLFFISFLIRPYAVIAIISFYIFLYDDIGFKFRAFIMLSVFVLSAWGKNIFMFLADSLIVTISLFCSPNPIDIKNWKFFNDSIVLKFPFFLTLETTFITFVLVVCVFLYFFSKIERELFFKFFYSILLCSFVLTVSGYVVQLGVNGAFAIYGIDMPRKKIFIWPLIMSWVTYTLTVLRSTLTKKVLI